MAALLELCPEPAAFIARMNGLGLPGVAVRAVPSVKCGISGTHMEVTVHGEEELADNDGQNRDGEHHEHRHMHTQEHAHGTGLPGIRHMISHLDLPEKVKQDAIAVYTLIAEAEGHVHGKTVEQIHFHEVGTMDAVADVVGVCLLMDMLSPEQVIASAVHVGSGTVHCAHGVLPVPAPATAYLLQGIPVYSKEIQGELCTPTGAALLKYFVSSFGSLPQMTVQKIGYGMGSKEFPAANCLRALIGSTQSQTEQVVELCCNLDDMTPEAIGFAQEQLFLGGALEVYTVAAGMKKSRPGVLLYCICRESSKEQLLRLLFLHTTTIGVREYLCNRYTLARTSKSITTPDGEVKIKAVSGWGVNREKPEYEDMVRIARETGRSLEQVKESLSAYKKQQE